MEPSGVQVPSVLTCLCKDTPACLVPSGLASGSPRNPTKKNKCVETEEVEEAAAEDEDSAGMEGGIRQGGRDARCLRPDFSSGCPRPPETRRGPRSSRPRRATGVSSRVSGGPRFTS